MYSAVRRDPWAQLSFRESDLPDQVKSLIGHPFNVCELDSVGRNCWWAVLLYDNLGTRAQARAVRPILMINLYVFSLG